MANEATAQMLERVKDLSRLEHALRPPKARGGFGELLLENLLRDRLPPGAYTMQHGFRSAQMTVWVDGEQAYSGKLTGSTKKKFAS